MRISQRFSTVIGPIVDADAAARSARDIGVRNPLTRLAREKVHRDSAR